MFTSFVESSSVRSNQVDTALRVLNDYYADHFNALDDNWAFPWKDTRLVSKINEAVQRNRPFVIGTVGSSVVAGHDNCQYDSFQNQLQRFLAPVFQSFGVDFVVRNAGEGGGCGDTYQNQIWCMKHLVGDDVDMIVYSWTYFEAGDRDVSKWHEMFTRWALLMPKSPIPIILSMGGCNDHARDDKIYEQYGSTFGFNHLNAQCGLSKTGLYPGKHWGRIGDGLHNTTRYGEKEQEIRKKSLGVVWRNWHPGPLMFQMIADTFALKILDAFKTIQTKFVPKHHLIKPHELGKPLFCPNEWCEIDEPPSCVNFEKPTHGQAQIRIVDEEDELNPFDSKPMEGFNMVVPGPSRLIPREERGEKRCEHLDFCSMYTETNQEEQDATMTVRLPRMTTGFLAICGRNTQHMLERLTVELGDESYIIQPKRTIFAKRKCVEILSRFEESRIINDSGGHIYMRIRVKNFNSRHSISLSHIIAL